METPLVTDCLLDINNSSAIDGTTVAAAVHAGNREHLWDSRPSPEIDAVVIHYISALDRDPGNPFELASILKIFCDLAVSSHYLILRDGRIFRLVPDDKRAWHCGGSVMPGPDGRTGVNDFSLGIELVATHDSGFTADQYVSCASLIKSIEHRNEKKCALVGHQDIAGTEAVRRGLRSDVKRDPGPLFDWRLLAEQMTSFSSGNL